MKESSHEGKGEIEQKPEPCVLGQEKPDHIFSLLVVCIKSAKGVNSLICCVLFPRSVCF